MPERDWPQVGDVVDYHAIIGGKISIYGTRVRYVQDMPSVDVPGGRRVAWIDGKSGCVAVEALTPHKGNQ